MALEVKQCEAEMAPEPNKAKSFSSSRASACARSTQAEQPSVIGNLIEQSLLLARKTWPMLAGVREPVRGPVKGKRNQS